jgi:hypothetical protein
MKGFRYSPFIRGLHSGTASPGCPVERSSTALSPCSPLPGFARPHSRRRLSPCGNSGKVLRLLLLLLSACVFASGQTLTGTAKNVTAGAPASGDEVVLLSLGQGMEEAGRTHTDSKGNFSFKLDNAQTPHLVRVIHEGVTYHRMAPPGTTSVNVEVFDVGKKIEGIEVVADIMRVQAEQGSLEIMRQFAVQNSSKPPRTQMNERNLEFYVPEGAQIIEASAMTEGGNPLNSAPVPVDDKKTRYAFLFPLRPGTTQFEVAYQLPYTGSANIDPKSIYPLEHFVAMVPKAMQFSAAPGTNFELKDYPRQPDANVEVASGIKVGQPLAFKISGAGTLASGDAGEASGGGQAPPAQSESRPGGGLGPPIDAPDPLQKYRWWILGGFALALVIGGVFVASRQQAANRAARSQGAGGASNENEEEDDYAEAPAVREARPSEARGVEGKFSETRSRVSPSRGSTSMLLEGLKDELFELEVEHKQGRISQKEYETAKSALDHTLERALRREAAKQG